jgi:hypothetical protein
MNIFYLDNDPRQCAEWAVDRHVVKMIVETAQLLSTAHRVLDGKEQKMVYEKNGKTRSKTVWYLDDDRDTIIYRATHINHPSAIWARQSVENYNWLVDYLFALGDEYTYRYEKKHKTMSEMSYMLASPPFNLKDWDWTTPLCAMPDEYKISDDPVVNYRELYKYGKAHLHKWKKRQPPEWIA